MASQMTKVHPKKKRVPQNVHICMTFFVEYKRRNLAEFPSYCSIQWKHTVLLSSKRTQNHY